MLKHPTLDHLRAMKLDGMADAFVELAQQDNARDLGHAEWLALLIDREVTNRGSKRFEARLRTARLRHSQAAMSYRQFLVTAGPVKRRRLRTDGRSFWR